VALLGSGFSAQQAWSGVALKDPLTDGDSRPVYQEWTEVSDVAAPVVVLAVGIKDLGGGGEVGVMFVGDAKSLCEEESQVVTFCVAKQVGGIAQADVYQEVDPRAA